MESQSVPLAENLLDNKPVPEKLLALDTSGQSESGKINIDGNLFGKFFCDRAEFYIIKNPQQEIHATRPESITLYYLDGKLSQARYVLREDILTPLLHAFGNFKISGLDFKNREILTSYTVVYKTGDGWMLNPLLDNIELTWTKGSKEIKYRVNTAKNAERFIYQEKLIGYEKEFKQIEKFCI